MKSILAIALICAGPAMADVTCDDCLTFGTAMQGYLMSDASVAEQTELLVAVLCPGAEDPVSCDEGIRYFWSKFALAMYPVFLEANSVCGQVGACKKNSYRKTMEATCEDCTAGIGAISGIISNEAKIAEIITFLKGDGYCTGEGSMDENCVMVVEALLPYAMPTLAGVLVERQETLCCELSTEGLCC